MSIRSLDILSSLETSGLQFWAHAREDEKQHTSAQVATAIFFIVNTFHEAAHVTEKAKTPQMPLPRRHFVKARLAVRRGHPASAASKLLMRLCGLTNIRPRGPRVNHHLAVPSFIGVNHGIVKNSSKD
jgi:hypothetical protein